MKKFILTFLIVLLWQNPGYCNIEIIRDFSEESLPILNENFRAVRAKAQRIDHIERYTEILSAIDGQLKDHDGDTIVSVETITVNAANETVYSDDDTIRFDAAGIEQLQIDATDISAVCDFNITKADPEIQLIDSGDNEYTRITRADTNSVAARYNMVLQQGELEGHWKLNDNAANEVVLDASGNSYDGEVSSVNTSTISSTDAKVDRSFEFSGATNTDLVDLPTSLLTSGLEEISICLWAKADSSTGAYDYVFYINEAQGPMTASLTFRGLSTEDKVTADVVGWSGLNLAVSSEAYDITEWHWYLITARENDAAHFYIDNVLIGTKDPFGAFYYSDYDGNCIGGRWNTGNSLAGHIDDFRILEHVISAETRALIYNSGSGTEASLSGVDDFAETRIWKSEDGTDEIERAILTIGDELTRTVIEGDSLRFNVNTTEQIRLDDGILYSTTDNDIDLGGSSNEFKNLRIDGLAYVDGFGEDTDLGDFDIHSIDGLYGVDDLVYIDMGTDGYLDLEADTGIRATAPLTIDTTLAFTLGSTRWDDGSDKINGEYIADNTIDDGSPDWGTGADQISALDIPIADAGTYLAATEVEAALQEITQEQLQHNLNGFEDASAVALSTDSGTPPTITLTFTGTVAWWSDGVRYTDTGTDAITLTDTTGIHYLYYDGATLTKAVAPAEAAVQIIFKDKAIASIIYWNTATDVAYVLSNELHGIEISGAAHYWIHDNIGSKYKSGLTMSDYTLATATDAALTFQVSDGDFYDEDLEINIADAANAAGQYEQILSGVDAEIPVLYRDSAGVWVEQAASTLPYIVSGTTLRYMDADNSYTQTSMTGNYFMNMFLIATNDWQYPIKMVQGTDEYSKKETALGTAAAESIDWSTLPSAEWIVLYQIILEEDTGTSVDGKISEVIDLRFADITGASATSQEHGGLTGLTDDDHTQYLLADATRALTADWDVGNYDLTFKAATGDGTIEGATITEGGNAVYNATELEGTVILSTGENGAVKFLREDGDGTSSWQTPALFSPTDFDTDYAAETVTSNWILNNQITFQTDKMFIGTTYTDEGINAGIDALSTEGGLVILPEGAYTVDGELTFDQNNTCIMGGGFGTHINISVDQTYDGFDINGTDGCRISNLQIEGEDGGTNTTDLIYDSNSGALYAAVDNCWIHHSDQYGIFWDSSANNFTRVTNNILSNCDNNGLQDYGYYSIISNNIAHDNAAQGLRTAANFGVMNSNIAYNNTLVGLAPEGGYHACVGNLSTYSGSDGFESSNGGTAFVGNVSAFNTGRGIDAAGADNSTVVGNVIFSNAPGLYGIDFGNTNDSVIVGNTIIGQSDQEYSVQMNVSTYNLFNSNISAYSDTVGMNFTTTADYNLILGNQFAHEDVASILNAGDDNQFLWNYFPPAAHGYTDTGTGTVFANWDEASHGFWFYNEDAAAGRTLLTLDRKTGSAADNDYYDVYFNHENDNDRQEDYARIRLTALDVTDGTEKGSLIFSVADGVDGSMDDIMTLDINGLALTAGINFPDTQNTSADVNTLDDYEEGTYTVTITPATSGTVTVLTAYDTATYTKTGRVVSVQGYIHVDTNSSPVGTGQISLPFAVADLTKLSGRSCGSIISSGLNIVTGKFEPLAMEGNSYFTIALSTSLSGWQEQSAAIFTADTGFVFELTYIAA